MGFAAWLRARFARRPSDDGAAPAPEPSTEPAPPASSAPPPRGPFDPLTGRGRFLRVLVDLTDRCNLKCVQCYFSLPGRDQRTAEISLAEFERLAAELLPHVRYLGLSCATEPFMHRDFLRVLEVVARHDVPWVYYITNATMLTERAVEATLSAGVDMVTISIDGARRETFESIRRNASFDKVLANVRRLRDAKRAAGSDKPRLQFNLTLLRANVEEIEEWLHLVKELGAEDVDLRHAVPYEGLDVRAQSLFEHKELTNRCLGRARALARELELHLVNCPDDFALEAPPAGRSSGATAASTSEPSHAPDEPAAPAALDPAEAPGRDSAPAPPTPAPATHLRAPCSMPWEMVLIHPDGGVIPCTNWHTHELMGNVREQSFEEIWNGPRYRALREELLTWKLGPNCRICPAMGFGSVDREESFSERRV